MKHILSALALVALFAVTANAQKQFGGEHNIELQLTPLGDTPIDGTTIKYRKFTSEEGALRVSLTFNNMKDRSIGFRQFDNFTGIGKPVPYYSVNPNESEIEGGIPAVAGATTPATGSGDAVPSPDLYDTYRSSVMMLAVGYEKHFDAGGDRLSPYVGFEVGYGMSSNSFEQEFWSAADLDNSPQPGGVADPAQYAVWTQTLSQSTSMLRLGLVTGFDAYLTDYLYIGAEAGLGITSSNVKDMEIEASSTTSYNLFWGQNLGSDDNLTEMPAPIQGSVDLIGHAYSASTNNVGNEAHPANINNSGYWYGNQQNGMTGNQFQAQLRIGYLFQ